MAAIEIGHIQRGSGPEVTDAELLRKLLVMAEALVHSGMEGLWKVAGRVKSVYGHI